MKTTINISIGGFAFTVEEDAYGILKNYLDAVEKGFEKENGGDEIRKDIEYRIVEIFRERLQGKEVLDLPDVHYMISIMGEPSIYGGNTEQKESYTEKSAHVDKRFYRDPDSRILGGVCSGIAAYFNIDPVWIRVAFLVAFIGYGTGFWVYIILWIAIPEAKTMAQKLAMRGKAPNLSNISNAIKNELNDSKDNWSKNKGEFAAAGRNFIGILGDILRKLVDFALKVARILLKIIAVFATLTCIAFLAMLTMVLLSRQDLNFGPLENWQQVETYVFQSETYAQWFYVLLVLLFAIPLIYLLYRSVLYLAGKRSHKIVSLVSLIFWLFSLSGVTYFGMDLLMEFKQDAQLTQTFTYPAGKKQLIRLLSNERDSIFDHIQADGSLLIRDVRLDIVSAQKDSLIRVKIVRSQHGRTRAQAAEEAKRITYNHLFQPGLLFIPSYFTLAPRQKYRSQEVEVKVYLPHGQPVLLDKTLAYILNDVESDGLILQEDLYGYNLRMTEKGLSCENCPQELFDKAKERYQEMNTQFTTDTIPDSTDSE